VKAFTFRLDQALRWRRTQVTAQQSRAATAATQRSGAEALLRSARAAAAGGAADIIDITREPTGFALSSYAAFIDRSRARIRQLEANLAATERALAVERDLLVAANQKLRLLENLKHDAQLSWRAEFDRELSAFADEAFLVCHDRVRRERDKIGKRTGA
jgi:flagellar export protein FliJ